MKNKYVTLVLGIIAAINVIYSFFGNNETGTIFSFELNIWLYRLVWVGVTFGFFLEYSKILKREKNQEE